MYLVKTFLKLFKIFFQIFLKNHNKYVILKIQNNQKGSANSMTMGEYIRKLRNGDNIYGRKWTQDELGSALNPPVNRAAVNKWETGMVENIKRTHIQQLANMFGVTPSELMCFDDQIDSSKVSEEVKVIESVQGEFGKDAVQLLQYFNELNEDGKQKALETISDLADHPKYTNKVGQIFDC